MFPGFNRAKRSTISSGDWDRDGVTNLKDCDAFNFRKQGPEHKQRCASCGGPLGKSTGHPGIDICEDCFYGDGPIVKVTKPEHKKALRETMDNEAEIEYRLRRNK